MSLPNLSRAGVALALAALVAVMAGNAMADKPATLIRDSIPDKYKWDLSQIYENWGAWEADFLKLQEVMKQYGALKGTLNTGPETLHRTFALSDTLGMLAYKVYRYPGLMQEVDSRNNAVKAKLQQVGILFSQFGIATAWFNPELLEIPWDTMKTWLDNTPDLKSYRYGIEDLYRQQEHVLSADKEQLLSYYSRANGAAGNIYGELTTSDIKYAEVTLSDGETQTVTPGTYQSILRTNRNQDDRRKAMNAFYGVYADNANTYAAIYDGILQMDWASAQARNYEGCVEAYLSGDNVPVAVYETLINTVREGCGPLHRYMELRKKHLGLETYHLYDGSVPLVDYDKTYPYDSIQAWVVESVKPLGEAYQKRMATAFTDRWIDVYENEGKSTGAFSAPVYGVHPYLLLNYSETLRDVFTVAHELGYCMYSELSNANQPFATAQYTIFVAEVASTLNEALFLEYMLSKAKDPKERVVILDQAIDDLVGVFFVQTMWADFELQMHRMVEQGQPITADVIADTYKKLVKTYDGDAVELDSLYSYTWTRISHF